MPAKTINPILEQVLWPLTNITAFTTTRVLPLANEISSNRINANDCSDKIKKNTFEHFNLGLHVGDNPKQVIANRQQLLRYLPSNARIQWVEQVHGNSVLNVAQVSEHIKTADAMYSKEENVALAIMTADCLPILMSSVDGSEIAAIHGGWRPLAQNIIANTVHQFNCPPNDILVWLGPCIGRYHFEVGQDVYNAFTTSSFINSDFINDETITHDASLASAFSSSGDNKYLANLHLIAKQQCEVLGIKSIYSLDECTYQSPHKYYSYRRDGQTGRMASIICRHS